MKRLYLIAVLCMAAQIAPAQTFRVGTYDMSSSESSVSVVNALDCDILALQEVSDLDGLKEGYDVVGFRDSLSGRDASIVYRTETFAMVSSGGFYLSSGRSARPCAWACLRHKPSGREFYFLSTRLSLPVVNEDGNLNYSRNKADMQRLREMTASLIPADTPSICAGDFNTGHKVKHWGTMANSRWYDIYQHLLAAGTLPEKVRSAGGESGLSDHICLNGFRPLGMDIAGAKTPVTADVAFCPEMDVTLYDTPAPLNDKTVRIVSSNIRFYNNATDLENGWDRRKSAFVHMMKDIKPSVIGFQECCEAQRQYLLDRCPDYDYVEWLVRQNEPDLKSYAAFTDPVMWDRNVLEMLSWDVFYLSETPDTCSISWDSAEPRSALWCHFRHKPTGKEFIFINTHLDHKGAVARKKGLDVILDKMKTVNVKGLPVVMVGDLNTQYKHDALDRMKKEWKDARVEAKDSDDKYSFNGFGKSWNGTVDYIWYDGFKRCHSYKVVVRKYNHVPFISDHYPIRADLEF